MILQEIYKVCSNSFNRHALSSDFFVAHISNEPIFLDEDEILFLLDDFIGPTYKALMKRKPPPSMLGPPAFIQKSKDKENEFTHIPNKVKINDIIQPLMQIFPHQILF